MPKPFTLTQLRYFAAVADAESMTVASERLLVTQSAVSTAIAELERSLGVQLFVRQKRRTLALTPAGRQFSQELRSFLEHADSLYESAQGLAGSLTGELRVGVFAPLAPVRLPVILHEFESEHPGIDVSVFEADLATMRSELLAGRCEVALTYGLGLGGGFQTEVIERIPPHAIVAADHPAARRPDRSIALRELADEPMIMLDLPHTREYYESFFQMIGTTPRIRHRFAGYETVRSFVASGHGYALLNQWLSHDLTYSGSSVVPLRLTDDFPPTW